MKITDHIQSKQTCVLLLHRAIIIMIVKTVEDNENFKLLCGSSMRTNKKISLITTLCTNRMLQ